MPRGGDQVIPRPPGTRAGAPAPWADLPVEARRPSVGDVRAAMARRPAPRTSPLEGTGVRASAVLCALWDEDGLAQVALTRRARHLRTHRGEVSFPGGGEEPEDDDLWATALREAWEETGIDPAAVERVGELDHLATVTSRSFIVPFVGVLPTRPDFRPDPTEVELIRAVPLAELLAEGVYREETWNIPPMERAIHFFELEGDTVWGATAAMLRDLLVTVTASPPGPPPDLSPGP